MRAHPVLLLLPLIALLSACGPESGPQPFDAAPGTELRRGNGGDPGSLDPARAEDLHAYRVLGDLYEGLLTATADGGTAPGVAESWTVSDDGLVWRFRLRTDAVWTNGERVTAGHFVTGLQASLDPAALSPNAFLLEPVANAAEVMRGDRGSESLGITAEGEDVLEIRLAHPAPWLPTVLSMPVAMPRLPAVHDDPGSFSSPDRFVGNGPYLLVARRPGGEILLARNTRFHAADTVAIETVRYLPIVDPVSEFNLYRAGELDLTATVPPALFESLRRERPCELKAMPSLGLYYFAFDVTEPPLDDPRLREALSLAIDREQLVAILGRGEIAAYGLLPPAIATDPSAAYAWRTLDRPARERRAREAFKAVAARASPPFIELTYDAGDVHRQVAVAVRAMWNEVLGIEVKLRQLEWKAFLDLRTDRRSWQVMRFSWAGDYDDATTFNRLFVAGGENNLPGYADPRYDALLSRASSVADPAARGALLADAERLLLGSYAIAPLYFMTNKSLVAPRVAGFSPNALDRHPSRWLRLRTVNPRSGSSEAARCGSGAAAS